MFILYTRMMIITDLTPWPVATDLAIPELLLCNFILIRFTQETCHEFC